jgi:hypothetical protein
VPDGSTLTEHDVHSVMNGAPLGEASVLVALAPDGTFAGLHTVFWAPWRPRVVNVADTACGAKTAVMRSGSG